MKRLTSQGWETLRILTAITAAIGTMICLLILAGCTNELTGQDENRGNGQALTLGTVSIEGGNTRAANAVPGVASGHSFRDDEKLHVALTAGSAQSTGTYLYDGNNSSWSSTKTKRAYWQGSGSHTLTAWWGPAYSSSSSPAVYNMPSDYETNTATAGSTLNAWDGKQYTAAADKWHITDLLHYSGTHSATSSSIDLVLKHSMAQLCVNLLPGDGITAEQLQKATVHLKQAKAYFIMNADGEPVIHHYSNEPSTHPDVRLLKNGSASSAHYALMLPGQTFAANRLMISIHIGNDIYKYLPTGSITTQANTCHKLKLKVNKAGVSALSVTSTGWQNPTQVEATEAENFVTVKNETAGSLLAEGSELKTALASAGQDSPIKVMITGEISDQDLANLKEQMIGGSNGNKYFKVSHLYITASGATTIPEGFCKTGDNNNTALQEVILPEGITSIGERAFQSCTTLKSIQLPKKVTKIGKYAFINCRQLTNIQLPDGVTEIGEYAFIDCSSLTEISIPTGVTKIGERTFQSCANLTSIQLPETVTKIGKYAFINCRQLTNIQLPDGVTEIGEYAFIDCSSLTEISIPTGVTKIGERTFQSCANLTSIQLPETVTEIGNQAFSQCKSLTKINIPEGVTEIGESTFASCTNLTSIQLPEGLTEIGSYAFVGCSSLKEINIPKGVKTIGERTFGGCENLTSIQLQEGLTEIGSAAFVTCSSLKDISIPKGVEKIAEATFLDCMSLTNIQLPETVTEIGSSAFVSCKSLEEISIPKGITKIAESTFQYCTNLTSIQLPETVTEINPNAFDGCRSLKEISIPKAVTSIGYNAFNSCSSLTEISIPQAVTSIEAGAFSSCYALEDIILSGTNDKGEFFLPSVGEYAFPYTATLLFLTDVTDDMFKTEENGTKCKSWGSITWKAIHYDLNTENPASLTDTGNYSGHWFKDSPQ